MMRCEKLRLRRGQNFGSRNQGAAGIQTNSNLQPSKKRHPTIRQPPKTNPNDIQKCPKAVTEFEEVHDFEDQASQSTTVAPTESTTLSFNGNRLMTSDYSSNTCSDSYTYSGPLVFDLLGDHLSDNGFYNVCSTSCSECRERRGFLEQLSSMRSSSAESMSDETGSWDYFDPDEMLSFGPVDCSQWVQDLILEEPQLGVGDETLKPFRNTRNPSAARRIGLTDQEQIMAIGGLGKNPASVETGSSESVEVRINAGARSTFKSNLGLIISCLGSAVGTGNIWRFPRILASHSSSRGSLAFYIAWVILLFCWSIPVILLEYALGRFTRNSVPVAFKKFLGNYSIWIGGWLVTSVFFLSSFHAPFDPGSLADSSLWIAAASQNAFDTGAGMALLMTYAMYVGHEAKIVHYSTFIPITNNLVSVYASITLFSTVFSTLVADNPCLTRSAIVKIIQTTGPGSTGLTFTWFSGRDAKFHVLVLARTNTELTIQIENILGLH
ncbi:unnamed protein product [Echinostoma caproni]|uniref:Neurotransmitter symporter family n=1 Tax=Echinostoma caproni TaxID=27848 RepID=A0A183A685_9TREM|nr:unnamed protein product [Echinostoma caproni]